MENSSAGSDRETQMRKRMAELDREGNFNPRLP